jgi:hypothetical protein
MPDHFQAKYGGKRPFSRGRLIGRGGDVASKQIYCTAARSTKVLASYCMAILEREKGSWRELVNQVEVVAPQARTDRCGARRL